MSYLSSGCEAVCFRIVCGKRYVMPVIAGNTGGAGSTDQHTLSAEAADWMLRVSVREEKKRKKYGPAVATLCCVHGWATL